MTEKQKKCLWCVYSILITVALLAAGICLIVACVGIYRSGDQPFSREIVAAAFSKIAVPVFVCLGMIAVGAVLHLFFPAVKKKEAPDRDLPRLRRLHAKITLAQCDPVLIASVRAEQRRRRLNRIITLCLLALGGLLFLCYALDGRHFHQSEINGSMIRAMWVLLPCMAVPFGYGVFAAYDSRKSVRREIALLEKVPTDCHRSATQPTAQKSSATW
ncbi:MAG: hypothetical protein J6K98_00670, partial [Clostridia bacterium]|nr:hypothetical protein [Clostridia bacterium]